MQTIEKSDYQRHRQFWSDFADDYLDNLYKNVKEYPSLVLRHRYILEMFESNGKYVADIGCGPGELICDLIDRGCRVFGIDIAEGMLEVALKNIRNRHPAAEVVLQAGNVESLEIGDRTFDAVVCAGVIEYLIKDDKALSELNRILKPGGDLIITVRNKACPFRPFDLFFDALKGTKTGLKLINRIKQYRGVDPAKYIPYRKHFPWQFDAGLKRHGFAKQDFRYFHFYPFFTPFHVMFPKFFLKYGIKMEKFAHSRLGILASGYIVKARKV
jgi:ubiquinone/menaquinone biosynthesis C-methylase UbiE